MLDGQKTYDVVVRYDEKSRDNIDAIRQTLVDAGENDRAGSGEKGESAGIPAPQKVPLALPTHARDLWTRLAHQRVIDGDDERNLRRQMQIERSSHRIEERSTARATF